MNNYFVDLHIHIGRDWYGGPVKITGSKNLTLTKVVEEASGSKGLDMVGVIDAQSPAVQKEIQSHLSKGEARELPGGGIQYNQTVLIPGAEIEVYDASCSGPVHLLCYFPYMKDMARFSKWLSKKMKNISLSSQRFYGTARELQSYVRDNGGLFIPAHIFTPFKSLYGKGVRTSLEEVLDNRFIDAVELGLSADTGMASHLYELQPFTYVTNSDAHSTANMAREYQSIRMKDPSFEELRLALHNRSGRKVNVNYGMDPRMGKYYQTVCAACLHQRSDNEEIRCPSCGKEKWIKGVSDRIRELSVRRQDRERPPYIPQVPLHTLPGIGPKTYQKLIEAFQNEMNIIHHASESDLIRLLPGSTVQRILDMRKGILSITKGGGGKYGVIR
ncbi:TIGR00375 family protein [Halobacillus litoralis]|uniref:TIGR00375 family protein n=1 Tax=Halobacillus litoralis TaxID=45668 RepID=A0A845DSI2_9BACI|nr:endonuclease Q family protein [Halobacillus litoralis]MYL19495.1 TIGR00375 family protein [Halobacillus litoralis]